MRKKLTEKNGETLAEALVSVMIISLTMAFLVTGIRAASGFFAKGSPSDFVFDLTRKEIISHDYPVTVTYKGMEKEALGVTGYAIEKEGTRVYVYYEASDRT